jgi:predicted CoA-binding protein
MKRSLILGASPNPSRYSHKATLMLSEKGHPVFPVGLRKGIIGEHDILLKNPIIENIDTLTLYVGPKNQLVYYDYILKEIAPKRIIFNPGTENNELIELATKNNIKSEVACTLVLLSLNQY